MDASTLDSGAGHWVTLAGGKRIFISDSTGKQIAPPAQGGAEAVKAGHAYVVAQKAEAAESATKAESIAANEVKAGGAIITTAKAGTITAWQGHSMSAVVKAAGSLGLGHSATVELLNSLGFSATAHSVKYTDLKKGKESHPLSPGELDSLKGAVTEFQAKGIKAGNATVTASGAGSDWKTINGHPVLLDSGGGVKAGGAYVIPSGAKATPAQAVEAQKPAAAPAKEEAVLINKKSATLTKATSAETKVAEPAPAAKETDSADASGQHWVTINGHKVLFSDAVAAIDHLAAGGMPSAFKGDQNAMESVIHAAAEYKSAGLGEEESPATKALLNSLSHADYQKFTNLCA